MMPFLLLAIGLLLIFLEFFLPGAILGIGGMIMVVVSLVMFAQQAESGLAVLAFGAGVVISIGCLIRFAIKRIRKTAKEGTMYLDTDQTGYVASSYDASTVGKEGIALSDLKPSGHVLISGRQYQALTESGYVVKGTPIVVLKGTGGHLIVKTLKKDSSS